MQLKNSKNMETISTIIDSFPWEDPQKYANFLAQTYYFVRHSTRLLMTAGGRMKHSDQVFFRRFLAHLGEENGHENLLLNDLKNLGYSINDFPETPETRMFWESQYYKIEHNDPLSLLGYIFVLEKLGAIEGSKLMNVIPGLYGQKACSFIKVHGEEDIDHIEKAVEQIESLPLHRYKLVKENIDQSISAYIIFLNKIAEVENEVSLSEAA